MKILADANNRGYTPYQEETLNPSLQSVGDTKEGLYFGREVSKGDPEADVPLHGPNQWPDAAQLPHFRPVVMQYYEACTRAAFRYGAAAVALDSVGHELDAGNGWHPSVAHSSRIVMIRCITKQGPLIAAKLRHFQSKDYVITSHDCTLC